MANDERQFVIMPLDRGHDRATFSCGVSALDRYLREQAGQDQQRHIARTFVLIDRTTSRIAGYYTLAAYGIEWQDLPATLTKRLPPYPRIPAILLGRLALHQDSRYRGKGLGGDLLSRALEHAFDLSNQIGAFAVVVQAKDLSAAAFYRHYNFIPFTDDPLRLFIAMGTIGKLRR